MRTLLPRTESIMAEPVVLVKGLDFRYREGQPLALRKLSFEIHQGQRCLIVGANGAGKTTLLRVLAGKHIIDEEKVLVLGRPAFHDTSLAEEVSFIGGPFKCDVDVTVAEMLEHRTGVDPRRREKLVRTLDIDPSWHMHRLSDGQRRRVHILLHLERPSRILLLDEVTADLDVVARADLLEFLRKDSEAGTAIAYATHIFDGLEDWATHIMLMEKGGLAFKGAVAHLEELDALRRESPSSPLFRLVDRWIRRGYEPRADIHRDRESGCG